MATSLITPKKANTMQLQSTSISKVRVIVRVRPFLPHEIAAAKNGNPISCASVLDQDCESGEEVVVHLNDQETSRRECYKLDSFLGPHDNNVSLIFYREVSPLIPGIFHGCNATVFAYGATGSGKTYTMQGTDELPGLMPLTMSAVLTMCWSTASTAEMSYYEVYMDRCYDLLEVKAKEIAILDDKDGQIHLKGLSRVPISSMSEFYEVFSHGIQRRKVAHTGLNDVSSRSHGVLVISVSTPCDDGFGAVVTGKLNLIDLAGNEDNRRTCNEGYPRVPYRESKLTRILQDSLGGTSRALMVACLNPGEYQESVHTVSLAARSRHISNSVPSAQKQDTPNVKVDMEAKLRAWLESKGKTKSAQRMRAFGSPLMSKAPSSLSSLKKPYPCHSSTKAKAITNQGASNAKERVLSVQHRNLFNNRGSVDSGTEIEVSLQSFNFAAENNTNNTEDEFKADDALANDKKMTTMKSANSIGSPPISEKFKALQGSLRKVLSPVNSDDSRKPLEDLSSKGQRGAVGVKGIGQKRAEYILELREASPLKMLSDLEKIGLSSKQVYNVFGRTAKGIFD
ncbi:Kinesin-like protein KIN-10B [Vitis vinifera]|uniref:Kinesin-like protein n=1 Tax=Vitis vinifera TaxID=29760 RepID=A0A438HSB2_VITVI|nr:Kinesin-like protein KIN-10B [Vitis vinifera]